MKNYSYNIMIDDNLNVMNLENLNGDTKAVRLSFTVNEKDNKVKIIFDKKTYDDAEPIYDILYDFQEKFNFYNDKKTEIQEYLEEYASYLQKDEYESCLKAMHDMNVQLNMMLNSTFWKMTKPARVVAHGIKMFVKNSFVLRLPYKAFVLLKNEGIKSTCKNIKFYLTHVKTLNKKEEYESAVELPEVRIEDLVAYDGTVSVVIPTYNGGSEFEGLLRSLKAQRNIANIEIVIVDSGSKDKTVFWSNILADKVIEISQEEFSHSYARNLGAKHTSGEYILFMVQDAMPSSDLWLSSMMKFVLAEGVTAVSCREEPKKDCDLYGKTGIWMHNTYMEIKRNDRILQYPKKPNIYAIRKNAQLSDVACVVKKSVFLEYKFRGDFAEDLDLGMRLIKDGYKLALLATVPVIHSHTRPAIYHLKRAIVDFNTLEKLLPGKGYHIDKKTTCNQIITAYFTAHYILKFIVDLPIENLGTEEFYKQISEHYGAVYTFLKHMQYRTLKKVVENSAFCDDNQLEQFMSKLFETIEDDYVCDVAIAEDQRYYITYLLRSYFKESNMILSTGLIMQMCDAYMKRFAEVSGRAIVSSLFYKEDSDLADIVETYSAGV